jgi:hypothetical protein
MIFMLCAATAPAIADEEDLYTVQVPLDPEDPESRNTAYAEALQLVLIRVTGSADPLHLESLAEVFANPSRYVLRYRPAPENSLLVSFDGAAIEQVLKHGRYTIWGVDRPLTLVWLAVDWGQGEREIIAANDAEQTSDTTRSIDRNRQLRERMQETAAFRAIPIAFPLLDTEDLRSISFSDIWGGFNEQLLDASRRYGASSILVGRIRPDAPQRNRWTYYFGDEQLTWSGEPEDVTNFLADRLVAQFGLHGDAELETFTVSVDGIDTIMAYGTVQRAIADLGVIDSFQLRSVKDKTVEYRVSIYGGIDRLNKALELSGILSPSEFISANEFGSFPMSDPNKLSFSYVPELIPDLIPELIP